MLVQLSIRNIVLIRKLDLELQKGLCVLTGETGAGKSILLDALGFVLGSRAKVSLLRHGQKKGSVSSLFDTTNNTLVHALLDAHDIDTQDGELTLRRTIDDNGKSKAYINDQLVTVSLLKQVGSMLVEIHGQHEHHRLLDGRANKDILDQFGKCQQELQAVSDCFKAYKKSKADLQVLLDLKDSAKQEEDYLQYVCKELEGLDLDVDEEELEQKRKRLRAKEKIQASLVQSYDLLSGGDDVVARIHQATSSLERSAQDADELKSVIEILERAVIDIAEVQQQLDVLAHKQDDDEDELETIEQALFSLKGAARKYNVPVDGLKDFYHRMQHKLSLISNYEEAFVDAHKELEAAQNSYIAAAKKLSHKRQEAAKKLETLVIAELEGLHMSGARFIIDFTVLEEEKWGITGTDEVRFMASMNPGMPPKPINQVASGGELSRFMLAFKVIVADIKSTSTLIFDEIDTGIGGATADAVGQRLQTLGSSAQILVVTHQPQVAAKGGLHLKIIKEKQEDSTETSVSALTVAERKIELARMLSGKDITKQAQDAAQTLLENAS